MRSPICLLLLLNLSLVACTNNSQGSENANPDASRYATITDEDGWNNFIRERQRELSLECRGSYYSTYDIGTCATETVSIATLNKRLLAWKRLRSAYKAAALSGKFGKYDTKSYEREAERMNKREEDFARGFKLARERRARQDKVLAQLNQTSCKAVRIEDDETQEISLKDCDPAKAADAYKIIPLLSQLKDNAAVRDNSNFQIAYERFKTVSPKYADLAQIKKSLSDRGVITITGSNVAVNGAGHPFGGTLELQELARYSKVAKEIASTLGSGDQCNAPCERSLFDVSSAVNFNYMDGYCGRSYGNAPSPDYLKTWYNMNNSAQLVILRINFGTAGKDFSSEIYSENTLTFPRLFSSQNVTLSISNWRKESVCLEAAPLFYIFQETEGVIAFLKRIGSDSASQVREIRFVPDNGLSNRVRAVRTGDGYIRLEIATVERAGTGKSVATIRDEIYRRIPDALAEAAR